MRKVITVCFAVVGFVAIAGQGLLAVPVEAKVEAKGEMVDICHFSGHRFDARVKDFLVKTTEDADTCNRLSGNVINISVNGWLNRHKQ